MSETQLPLFVYGTLLTGERAHSLLANSVERKAHAVMPGAVLYSLGAYPMLMDGHGQVSGEVVWITAEAYQELLAVLDGYEGPPYTRRRRSIRVFGCDEVRHGGEIDAWVYVGNEIPLESPQVPGGDWRSRPSEQNA
jgi:gamma-glutamylcyclotransferase (GGCT)/AIG2-like uncharacterized protein YtfP